MKKIFKICVFFVLLTVIIIAGLSIFIRAYLTEDRLKALIVPEVEKSLGRKVEIGAINVSLLKGIVVKDFSIKEQDQKTDFVKAGEFVLRYHLMPLLHKQIVISEIRLVDPSIEVIRDKAGQYNYESLYVLQAGKTKQARPKKGAGTKAAAASLALTVDSVVIRDGHVKFRDERGELPSVDTRTDCSLSLKMGKDIKSTIFSGSMEFDANLKYQKVASKIKGSIKFDNKRAQLGIVTLLDGQKIRFDGDVRNYLSTPDATLDISSEKLDLDKLLALAATVRTPTEKVRTRAKAQHRTSKDKTKAPPLKLKGKIDVKSLLYEPYAVQGLKLNYVLKGNTLMLQGISASFQGKGFKGDLTAKGNMDLLKKAGTVSIQPLNLRANGIKAVVSGSTAFDKKRLELDFNLAIDGQQARIFGAVRDYASAPDVTVNLDSNELDANKLLALLNVAPETKGGAIEEKASSPGGKNKGTPVQLPPKLKAHGLIQVAKLLYKDLVFNDLRLKYRLVNGIFFIDQLSAKTADGYINSKAQADITKAQIPFKGYLLIQGIDLPKMLQSLKSPMSGKLSGIFNGRFDFSGTGSQWDYLQKSLDVEGNYLLKDGEIKGIKVLSVIADLIGLPSLRNVDFKNLDGTIHVEKGLVRIKSVMTGRKISARAKGTVGLDGALNLPLTLVLSQDLSKKLEKKSSIAKYLTNKAGKTELSLKLTGTINRPRPAIDTSMVKERVKQKITNKVEKELGKLLGDTSKEKKPNSNQEEKITPEGLLKGLFGK